MKVKPYLSEELVTTIAAASRDEAKRNGWAVSIVIVDDGGHLLFVERHDGASPQTPEVATLKARTAAFTRSSTAKLEAAAKDRMTILGVPGRFAVQGGLPLMHEGTCIGAIGVSGMQSPQDEQVAQAGLASFSK